MVLRLAAASLLLCVVAVQAGYKQNVAPNFIHRTVRAVFNQLGVTGEVVFSQERSSDPVDIQVNLVGLDQFTDVYRWSIHDLPIHTSLLRNFPCTNNELGGVYNPLGSDLSNCVGNPSTCAIGDLTSKLGHLRNDMENQIFSDPNLELFGSQSIVGRSLVIDREISRNRTFICANIELNGRPSRRVETLRASFNNDVIQGDVIIRTPSGFDDATIEAAIYRVDGMMLDEDGFSWSLHFGPASENCSGLGQMYGSARYDPALYSCSMEAQRECIIGDLTSKCGPLDFENGVARAYCTDNQLGTVNMANIQPLIVQIANSSGASLGCAPFFNVRPLRADAEFRGFTEYGAFTFYQDGPDDETYIRASLTGLRRSRSPYSLRIFEGTGPPSDPCQRDQLGSMYRVPGRALFVGFNNILTADSCAIGNLQNVLPIDGTQSIRTTVSTNMPLFGPFSVIGRTLGLVDNSGNVVACSVIANSCTTCQPQGYNSLLGYQEISGAIN